MGEVGVVVIFCIAVAGNMGGGSRDDMRCDRWGRGSGDILHSSGR